MRAWSSWFPDLMLHVPGCPNVLAEHELRRAAQAFFRTTRSWKVIEAALPVVAGQSTVTTAPSDAGQELVRVESVSYDGVDMALKTIEDMPAEFGSQWASHTGTPSVYLQLTPGEILLYPMPDADATTGVVRTLSVQPSEAATGLPDDMAIQYRDDIHLGAKARLLSIPGKPWSNMDQAVMNGAAFDSKSSRANINAARSYGNGRITSRNKWC